MAKDDVYETVWKDRELLERDELHRLIDKVKNSDDVFDEVSQDELVAWRSHTIELSYRIRKRAMESYPGLELGNPEFDNFYTKCFRELDDIELESMILSHDLGIHVRRPQTINIIRDAYMNSFLLGDNGE